MSVFFDRIDGQRSCEQELLERREEDGHGVVDWTNVETVLGGVTELRPGCRSSLHKAPAREGLTRKFFGPGQHHEVTVNTSQGSNLAINVISKLALRSV